MFFHREGGRTDGRSVLVFKHHFRAVARNTLPMGQIDRLQITFLSLVLFPWPCFCANSHTSYLTDLLITKRFLGPNNLSAALLAFWWSDFPWAFLSHVCVLAGTRQHPLCEKLANRQGQARHRRHRYICLKSSCFKVCEEEKKGGEVW